MRVLGVDPGLVVTGYGVLEHTDSGIQLVEGGTVHCGGPERELPDRLRTLYEEISAVIEQHRPESMALEQLFAHYEHPRTAILMGHARGVICLAAGMQHVPLYHYTAPMVKSALTGNGRASKEQIQHMVQRTFGLAETPNPPDVADAVALALTHLLHHQSRFDAEVLRLLR